MAFDWKSIVRTVAPTIATALDGPVAGTAVNFLADKLLGKPGATQAEVAQAIATASPEQLIALKKLDEDFAAHMRELDIDLEKVNAADRASARDMAVKTTLLPQMVIGGVFVACFAAMAWSLFHGATFDEKIHDVVIYFLGILSAGMAQVLNFFFGSSAGSKEKDGHLAEIAKAP